MSEIQKQLKDKILELEQIRKVRQHVLQLNERLREEEKSLAVMEIMLDKEQKDVELLEREGLHAMFRKFLGDREERLEKEREEYLRASLRFNELFKSVELIRFELDLLIKKEQNLERVQGEVEILIRQREEELMKGNQAESEELRGLFQHADKQQKFFNEIEEAMNAGKQAYKFVMQAEEYLREAQRLGQRDMWGGGYHGIGQRKHDSIDKAREMVYKSRHYLIAFANELRDVFNNSPIHFDINIEEFSTFGDVFFDNLISDWMVQQKINKSLVSVSTTRQHVERILNQLDEEMVVVKKNLDMIEEQRRKIIINS
jgi:hypothetical protein